MLSRLDSALRSESGEVLAAAIRTRFPVAMIDEFQDTDPSSTEFFAEAAHENAKAFHDKCENKDLRVCGRGYLHLYEGA